MSWTKIDEFFQKSRLNASKRSGPQDPQFHPDIYSTGVKTDQISPTKNQSNMISDNDPQDLISLPGDCDKAKPFFYPITGWVSEYELSWFQTRAK